MPAERDLRRVIGDGDAIPDGEVEGRRRAGAARALPLDGAAADVRRALGRLPPPGPDRHVRDLLGPRGDPGRRVPRARGRRLDLPELPRVGDRAPARACRRRRSSPGGAAIPAGWWNPADYNLASICVPIATQVPHAAGLAWGKRLRGETACALTFFGDGATSEGAFHEGANFAAVMRAPLVLLCNNNQWAISTPLSAQTNAEALVDKAAGYGIPGARVDGGDVLAVYEATREAVARARAGEGPTLHRGGHLPRRAARDRGRSEGVHRSRAGRGGARERVRRPLRGLSPPAGGAPRRARRADQGRGGRRDARRDRRRRGRAARRRRPPLRARARRPARVVRARPRRAAEDPR